MLWNRTPALESMQALRRVARGALRNSPARAAQSLLRVVKDLRPGCLPRDNAPMAPPPGRRRSVPARRSTLSVLALVLGVVAAAIGWVALVVVAVDFGRQGREGDALGWAFLAVGAAGATACLLLALLLGTRLLTVVGLLDAYQPKRAARRGR